MAKINVAGESVVITSDIKFDDYKMVAKYRPEKLVLKGGTDNEEPVFAIGIASDPRGSINRVGAEFGSEAHDGSGRATITMDLPKTDGDIKEAVAEYIGSAILDLNKLEETIPEVVREIAAEKSAVIKNITLQ